MTTGLLVNADGLKVQAFKYDEANLTNEYGDVAINVNAVLPAMPTELIAFSENLSADAIDGSVYSQQIKVVDDKGISSRATIYFKKSTNNECGHIH